ncbi:unnamed protein product [Closterium sp. NIES-54]
MFTNSASAIVVGLVLDRTGPRRTTLIGTVIFALGLLALAGAGTFAPGAHNDSAPDAATPPSVSNSTDTSNSTANATVVMPAMAEFANTSASAAVVITQPPRGLMRVEAAPRNGGVPLPGGSWAQLTGGNRGAHGAGEGARMVKVMGKWGAARVERAGWVEGHACWRRSRGCLGEQVMRGDQGVQRRELEAEGQGKAGVTAEGSSGGKEAASGVFFFAAFFLLSLGGPFIFTSSVRVPPPLLSFSMIPPTLPCLIPPLLRTASRSPPPPTRSPSPSLCHPHFPPSPNQLSVSSSHASLPPILPHFVSPSRAGAFEASSLILFLLGLAVTRLHLPLSALALAYCLVPLALAALAAAVFPNSPFGATKSGASGGRGDLGDAAAAGVRVRGDGGGDGAEVGVGGKEGDGKEEGEVVLVGRLVEEEGRGIEVTGDGIADDEGIEECSSSSSSSSISSSGGEEKIGSGERERKDSVLALVYRSGSSDDGGENVGEGGGEGEVDGEGGGGTGEGGQWEKGELGRLYSLRLAQAAAASAAAGAAVAKAAEEAGAAEEARGAAGARAAREERDMEGIAPPPHIFNSPLKHQLRAPLFWVHVAVSAYLVLRSNFFIAAVNSHIHYTVTTLLSIPPSTATTDLPSDAAAQVTSYIDIFNIVLAAGGVFAVPLAGWSMERPGLPFSFALTTLLCALCSAVQMMAAWVPLPMQLVAFLAFAIARAFIYSTMAAYVGTLFGFRNFGRLYGINRLGGAFLTLLQYPLMRQERTRRRVIRSGSARGNGVARKGSGRRGATLARQAVAAGLRLRARRSAHRRYR